MKSTHLFFSMFLILAVIFPASAFVVKEGGNIVIDTPISDDLLVSGGTVTVSAPVRSITFAGGTLTVNAPVERNIIGCGGQILVNAPVGADLIAAGGQISATGPVTGKILAAGGHVVVNGNVSNVAISGGTVDLGTRSHVTGDALISASDCRTDGVVEGKLDARTDQNRKHSSFNFREMLSALTTALFYLQILFTIGMIILGILLVYFMPLQTGAVITAMRENPLLALVFGVVGSILAFVIGIILLATIVGIPIALVIGLITLLGLLLSTLFTGAALGALIETKLQIELSPVLSFLIGFIILQIIFFIPVLGFICEIFTVFIGLGALAMACGNRIRSGV